MTLDALRQLSADWLKDADETEAVGDFCCALTRRNDAVELYDLLSSLGTRTEAPQTGWRPIETCPRGGMALFCSMSPTIQARDWCWVDWMTNRGMMLRPNGLATHWMPLPAPPPATQEREPHE